MKEFIKRLGKFVQGLLNKIKKPKKQSRQKNEKLLECSFSLNDEQIVDLEALKNSLRAPLEITVDNSQWDAEMLEKYFNIYRTLLPKRYWCKTLLLSLIANQESDYQAVDMSQYEEKGLAHYILGRKCSWEELLEEYCEINEEERAWFSEEIKRAKEDGIYSSLIGKATLLYYEDVGIWDIEEFEDEI